MSRKSVESCGRCGLSTLVDATTGDRDADEIDETLFGGGHITVDEQDLRRVSPHLVLGERLNAWLNRCGERVIFGRK